MAGHKIKRILVAVKPDTDELPLAATHARFLAQSFAAEIALLSCVSEVRLASGLAAADPAAVEAMQTAWLEREHEALDRLAEPLRKTGVKVTTRVSVRSPIYASILEEAEAWSADLVVVGIHEPRPVPHTRLTDVDWQLMRLCPRPLLLVADPTIESYRTILAAVDPLHRHAEPSGLDAAVVETAEQFAVAFQARLCVANIYPSPDDYEIVSSVEVEPGVFYGTENIKAAHLKAVEKLLGRARSKRVDILLQSGRPAIEIAALAAQQKAELVVLGSVKRNRLEVALMGSTAEAVVADASCDILLVQRAREVSEEHDE